MFTESNERPIDRSVLESYPAPQASSDVFPRLLVRLRRERARAARRGVWMLCAAAAAAALTGIGLYTTFRETERTVNHQVASQTSIPLPGRGTCLAEAGSVLAVRLRAGEAIGVSQKAGDAAYAIDPGGPFVVETPAAAVRVVGTRFRVGIRDEYTQVTVEEGRVVLENARGSVALAAGDAGRAMAGAPPGVPGT